MQWRLNFLQDIQLYYQLLSRKLTEIKKRAMGAGTVKESLLYSQQTACGGVFEISNF